jgi:hypothetical protein
MAALGDALPPQARSGLMLFLRRGMWAWGRALIAESLAQEPIHAPSFAQTACSDMPARRIFPAMLVSSVLRVLVAAKSPSSRDRNGACEQPEGLRVGPPWRTPDAKKCGFVAAQIDSGEGERVRKAAVPLQGRRYFVQA